MPAGPALVGYLGTWAPLVRSIETGAQERNPRAHWLPILPGEGDRKPALFGGRPRHTKDSYDARTCATLSLSPNLRRTLPARIAASPPTCHLLAFAVSGSGTQPPPGYQQDGPRDPVLRGPRDRDRRLAPLGEPLDQRCGNFKHTI